MTNIKVRTDAPQFLFSRLATFKFMKDNYDDVNTLYNSPGYKLNKFDRSVIVSVYRFTDDLITDLRDTYYNETKMSQFITQNHIHFCLNSSPYEHGDKVSLSDIVYIRNEMANFLL